MKFNQDFINANFKDMWATSRLDGVPIPNLIQNIVPLEYLPNDEYIQEVDEKMTKKAKETLFNNYIKQRVEFVDFFNKLKNNNRTRGKIFKYLEKEVEEWIDHYPQYKLIIQ